MKNKKKKGSSFIIVLFITAIIFTTATTMIAVVTNDYKTRVNQSKSLQNLYESDSNLDYAYTSIVKNSQMASLVAYNKVAKDYEGYSEDEIKKDDVNKLFKKYFLQALTGYTDDKSSDDPNKNYDGTKPVFFGIEKLAYMNYEDVDQNTVRDFPSSTSDWTGIDRDNASNTEYDVNVEGFKVDFTNYTLKIKLKSTFNSKSDSVQKLSNKKTIRTSYTISAPDYTGVVDNDGKDGSVNIYSVDSRAITADGDLKVDGKDINISGDIWIKGNSNTVGDNDKISYDKYYSGIVLGTNVETSLNMDGNIYTPRTLTLQNNAKLNSSNIYALNVYLGALKYGTTSINNSLVAKNVVTNNDLTMNSSSSSVDIDEYYGINDYKENATETDCSTNSSSIIVNKTDSKLKINKATVMGVAYIDADGSQYQTGESVAVKGNYKAYATVLPSYEDKVKLQSIDSVKLIESINGDSSSTEKAKYFVDYYNKYNDALTGGVDITELYATGASVNQNGNAERTGVEGVDLTDLKEKYAKYVFDMALTEKTYEDKELSNIYSNCTNNLKYTQKQVAKIGDNNGVVDFSKFGTELCSKESIMIDNVSYQDEAEKKLETKIYDLLLNGTKGLGKNESAKDVTISVESRNGKDVAVIKVGNEEKYVSDDDSVNCFLITAGNVIIKDNVKFNGAIVAGGNVKLQGNNISINYDEAKLATTKLAYQIAFGEDKFNNIYSLKEYKDVQVGLEYYPSMEALNKVAFDADTYVKEGLWQLEK